MVCVLHSCSASAALLYIQKRMMLAAANVIALVSAGERYESCQDKEVADLLDGIHGILRGGIVAFLATMMFSWTVHIPSVRQSANALKKGCDKMNTIFVKKIQEHKKTLDEHNPRDFIDEYLIEMKRSKDLERELFTDENLLGTIHNLYSAGMETSVSTIFFSCLVLANRPEVMKKVHAEIDGVIGSEGRPHFVRREKMPYCHACLREIMRYRTILPMLLPRSLADNVQFGKYTIMKGTNIIPNVYAVHNNPDYWEGPDEFIPERHIGPDGKVKLTSKYFLPFGLGPRLCIGRNLAEMEIFIFFVTIFQRFDAVPTPTADSERPFVQEDADFCGVTLAPPEHPQVTLIRRKI